MKKNLTAMTLAGVIVASNIMPICADSKFNDVNNHWAKQSIEGFTSKGYINGYQDGSFKPDADITRAEFVKIVNKYFNYTESFIEEFTDINERDWYYYDFCIALNAGYMKGYSDGSMKPNKYITREEVASILSSIKNIKDSDYDKIYKYIDNKNISDWAKSSLEGALEAGYLKGNDKDELQPKKNITRAEAVVSLSRIDTNKPNTGETEKPNVDNNKPNTGDTNKPSTGKVYSSVNDTEFKEIVNTEMFKLVNDHRRANGVAPLQRDNRLDRISEKWSQYMFDKDFFDHADSTGRKASEVFAESGVGATGENIGANGIDKGTKGYSIDLVKYHKTINEDLAKDLAYAMFDGWKQSPGHNKNMLNSKYTKFGFGYATQLDFVDEITVLSTQEFMF